MFACCHVSNKFDLLPPSGEGGLCCRKKKCRGIPSLKIKFERCARRSFSLRIYLFPRRCSEKSLWKVCLPPRLLRMMFFAIVPGYPERKRVLRLLDQNSRARISVFWVRSLVGGLRSELRRISVLGSVGALSADHVCSENEKC